MEHKTELANIVDHIINLRLKIQKMGQQEKEANIELHNLKLESQKLFTTEKVVRVVEENPELPLFLIEKVDRDTSLL